MLSLLRYLFVTMVLFCSFQALAADFRFSLDPSGYGYSSSALAACKKYGSSQGYTGHYITHAGGGQTYYCYAKSPNDSSAGIVGVVSRYGNSCPSGTQYESESGECTAPVVPGGEQCGYSEVTGPKITNAQGQCVSVFDADTPSQCTYLSQMPRVATIAVQFTDDGSVISPPPITKAGCAASVQSVAHCKAPVARETGGNGLKIVLKSAYADCKVTLNFTGEPADDGGPVPLGPGTSGTDGVCPDGDCVPDKELPRVNESEPCRYVTDSSNPSGASTCSSWNFAATPGEATNCGSVNGKFQCLGKPPASQGWQIDTSVQTKDNGDGTKTETKTDVHNETKCIGANACVTKTTTNKSVTIKGSNGETLGQSSECTGPNCASGGTGGKGDSNGDGVSDCAAGGDCSEEAESGSQGGGCDGGDCGFTAPDGLGDDIPTFSDSFQSMYSGVMSSPIVSAVTSIHFPSGGVAPTGGVEVLGVNISFDSYIDLWLQIAPILSAVFLAVWCLLAIRILFSA